MFSVSETDSQGHPVCVHSSRQVGPPVRHKNDPKRHHKWNNLGSHFRPSAVSLSLSHALRAARHTFISVFLPAGYPHTVAPDYAQYQIYDTIQAFSSSIASLLANRAVLAAVGVGDGSSTSTSALYVSVLQETAGRLSTILFAWRVGQWIEPECKKWRFAADIVNDAAIIADCAAPLAVQRFSSTNSKGSGGYTVKIILLCTAGVLRSICGVIGNGSRAALTQHFTDVPGGGSVADVSAKDASQETIISLLGMLAGTAVVSRVPEGPAGAVKGFTVLFCLLAVHLITNYRAVGSVVLRNLNRQRAFIVFAELEAGAVPPPSRVSRKERILPWRDGVAVVGSRLGGWARGEAEQVTGEARFVASLTEFLRFAPRGMTLGELADLTERSARGRRKWRNFLSVDLQEYTIGYFLWFVEVPVGLQGRIEPLVLISMYRAGQRSGSETHRTQYEHYMELQAWYHAWLVVGAWAAGLGKRETDVARVVAETSAKAEAEFWAGQPDGPANGPTEAEAAPELYWRLEAAGWDIGRTMVNPEGIRNEFMSS